MQPDDRIIMEAPKCGLLRPRPIRPTNSKKSQFLEPPPVEKKYQSSILPIEEQKPSLVHAAETLEAPIVQMHQIIRQAVPVVAVPLIYQKVLVPAPSIYISFQDQTSSSENNSQV